MRKTPRTFTLEEIAQIGDDQPLMLIDAAAVAFPHGGIKARSLRLEISKGRLEYELIAGKYFVTLRGIRAMRELCRVAPHTAMRVRAQTDCALATASALSHIEERLAEIRARSKSERNGKIGKGRRP